MANQILPFCATDSGTNLPTQGDYSADPNRAIGNSPGVASSKLNNKPLRQSTFVASQVAQYVADTTGADVLDDAVPARLLAQMNMALQRFSPEVTKITSGPGTFYKTYIFGIATGSATIGATYTNNGFTFTVKYTVASGVQIYMVGTGAPAVSGTLTKSGGTGDATLTFYAMRAPLVLEVLAVGGGGGGAGSGTSGGSASGNGTATTFGTSLLSAPGGTGGGFGGAGGAGGASTINSPAVELFAHRGSPGGTSQQQVAVSYVLASGYGGNSFLGGGGKQIYATAAGEAGVANTGSGSSGGGYTGASGVTGGGGGSGAALKAMIPGTHAVSYAYTIGSGGSAGGGGGGGGASGNTGATGVIFVYEMYQ